MNEKFEMQNSPEATCDCCTWDVVLTRVLSTSCYIYSPRCHLLERTALRVSSFFPQSDRIRPLSPFRSIFPSDRSLFFFLFFPLHDPKHERFDRSILHRAHLCPLPLSLFSRSPGNFPTSSDDNRQQPGWRRWTDVDGQTIHKYIDRR